MKVEEFVMWVINHGCTITNKNTLRQFWPELAAMSELINFPCGPFEENRCASGREKGCCSICANSTGYFDGFLPRDVEYYAKFFDRTHGFYVPGYGCTLPRSRRSLTCAFYICNRREMMKEVNSSKIMEFFHAVREYQSHWRLATNFEVATGHRTEKGLKISAQKATKARSILKYHMTKLQREQGLAWDSSSGKLVPPAQEEIDVRKGIIFHKLWLDDSRCITSHTRRDSHPELFHYLKAAA